MTPPSPAEGRVELRLCWDGTAVTRAEIQSRRPQPRRLLVGQRPEQALAVIPRLYSLCGDAQSVAVEALLRLLEDPGVSGGDPPEGRPINAERLQAAGVAGAAQAHWAARIRLETIREHLWRLGLDWPQLLGEPPQPGPLRELLAGREALIADPERARAWAASTRQALFGAAPVRWLQDADPALFDQWLNAAPTALAGLLRGLQPRLQGLGVSDRPLFRRADLVGWAHEAAQRLPHEPDLHWRPDRAGRVFEMGPLARIRDGRRTAAPVAGAPTCDAWGRVVARVLELTQELHALEEGQPATQTLVGHRTANTATVALEMARGVLLHWVRVEAGRIEDYRIIAPTEWNFHPQGPAWQGLRTLRGDTEEVLRAAVNLQVMALDPCVNYELEIVHA